MRQADRIRPLQGSMLLRRARPGLRLAAASLDDLGGYRNTAFQASATHSPP